MPDLTQYVPPGVYVDADKLPVITTVGIDPTIVALVGTGVGYHTFNEVISFDTVDSVALSKHGINASSIVVTGSVTDPGAPSQSIPHTFVLTDDYTVAVDSSGGADNSVATITRVTGGDIENGYPQVTVTYRYTDAEYHALNAFDDYTSFVEMYGPPLDPATGAILSPLSLAAQVAMRNGATRLYAVALSGTGTLQEQFAAAYTLISSSDSSSGINVVVPLWDTVTVGTTIQGMLQTLRSFLAADAADSVLRMAVVGLDSGYAPTAQDVSNLAEQLLYERIVLVWPNQVSAYNDVLTTTQTVDGFYLAAAAAGLMTAQAPQVPLTHKRPQGFIGFPLPVQAALTKSVKDSLSSSGVLVAETNRSGALVIRHGVTTNFAGGVLLREISVVRARDGLFNLIYDTLDSTGLVGDPITVGSEMQVKGIVIGALEQAKAAGLIFDYRDVQSRQQIAPGGDPTIIDVRFAYKPSYPLNYIFATMTVDTESGDTTITQVAA